MTDTDRILRLPEVMTLTGLGRTSVYLGCREGWFPQRVKLTKRAVGWRHSEIEAWLAARGAEGVSVGVSAESNAA
jgi:prophage regulatory protein